MAKVDLEKLCPWLTEDKRAEISDEEAEAISKDLNHGESHQRKIYRYNANYSLDRQDGIEFETSDKIKSPLSIIIEDLDRQLIHAAIAKLPDKQAKRIYAFFFLEMSVTEIAKAEGVSKQSVTDSLTHATKNLKNSLTKEFQERLERKV